MLDVPEHLRGLRELALFVGAGGDALASKLLGWETKGYVENNEYCQKVLRARIKDGCIDDAPIYDDVTKFDGTEWRGKVDVVSGGFPCFVAGTMVLSKSGYRPIEEIAVGDEVLTHEGRWRTVTSIMRKPQAPVMRIRAQGCPGIVCTEEHPFFARLRTREWSREKRNNVRAFSDPSWVDARDLTTNHFLGQVLPPVKEDPHPPAFWWLVGRYLAHGWRVRRKGRPGAGRVVIAGAHKEASELGRRIREAGFDPCPTKERTVTKFHLTRKCLYQFLEPFGRYAHGKCVPGDVLSLPPHLAESLVEGWLSGDGYTDPNPTRGNPYRRGTTVSKALALGMALLAQRACGRVASVRRVPMKPKTRIEGREVNQRDFYTVTIPQSNRIAFVEGSRGWKCITKIEDEGYADVFNLAVDEDESYIVDGAIVHNCQPWSQAGQRKGAADERNLWPDTLRVLREVRPRYGFLENVPALLYASHGYFGTVLGGLAEIGYDAVWEVIPASAIGAPHRRDRLWIVAHTDDPG